MSAKKLKTSHTNDNKLSEAQIKDNLVKLINEKSDKISFTSIESKVVCLDTYKRVLNNNIKTDYVMCDKCKHLIKFNRNSGSNGVKRHTCIPNSLQSNESILRHLYKPSTSESHIKSDLTETLVLFIARDMRPINIIKGEGFRKMAQKLIEIGSKNPNIPIENVLPSTTSVSNNIPLIYEKLKNKLIAIMKNVETLGVTCDHWTHDCTKINYITVTIQYISGYNIISRVLATINTSYKTASALKSDVNMILSEFNLNDKQLYYTTDNASAMKLAFNDMNWISCSAHNFNLLHKNSFKILKTNDMTNKITETIKNCKQLVQHFKHSGLQNKLDIKLKQSISVRWDTKYLMLNSIMN